jgi:DNA-binding PadR family transcriptional regulator
MRGMHGCGKHGRGYGARQRKEFGWPGAGPRARRGNVRQAILALLAERPMHGYEMIQELGTRTNGLWRPSAGSIYPTLQLLEDEGLVASTESEGRRRYALTDTGQGEAQTIDPPPWEEFLAANDPADSSLRDAAFQLRAAVMQVARVGDTEQTEKVRDLLRETRRRVYAVLSEDAQS